MSDYQIGIQIIHQLPPELQEMILDYVMEEYRTIWKRKMNSCNDEYHKSWFVQEFEFSEYNRYNWYMKKRYTSDDNNYTPEMGMANYRLLSLLDNKNIYCFRNGIRGKMPWDNGNHVARLPKNY